MTSIPVWRPNCSYRQTRKGKIFQQTSELYIRDDLGFGFTIPSQTSTKRNNVTVTVSGSAKQISNAEELLGLLIPSFSNHTKKEKIRLVVVDTNVLLHNLDVLEHPSAAIANLVISQTVLLECRHRNFTAYNRVLDLLRSSSSSNDYQNGSKSSRRCAIFFPDTHHSGIESSISDLDSLLEVSHNDENDAKIRQVAFFYGEALSGSDVEVILLTDDKKCRELALKEQHESFANETQNSNIFIYHPKSVRDHISELEKDDPELSLTDLVAQFSSVASHLRQTNFFTPHMSQSDVSNGIKSGKYFQGFIRSERGRCDQCYVTVRQGEERVAVSILGDQDINRALDGDVVAIELKPTEKWIRGSDSVTSTKIENSVGIAADTAEPSVKDENNVLDSIEIQPSVISKPTGRVVGILRRNFRKDYCGSIYSISSHQEISTEKDYTSDSLKDSILQEYEIEHPDGTTTCVFFAVDARIPPVLVRTSQREKLLGKRILIAIDSWPVESRYPLGHYVKTIGDSGGKDVETEVLLHEFNIPCDPFPAKVSKKVYNRLIWI